jgi:hypothetical protein
VTTTAIHQLGYGRWPDVGNDEIPCCEGSAALDHKFCTCWEPVFDVDQADPDTSQIHSIMPRPCHDCAYRRNSPERSGDDRAAAGQDDLDRLIATRTPFWCHDGMRRPIAWRHPSGIQITGCDLDYRPPIVDGVPYRADGRPGDLCAGWAARALKVSTA